MEELYNFWFSDKQEYKKYWFDKSIDDEIKTKYLGMYKLAESNKLNEWVNINYKHHLILIILLDQFSRNLKRCDIEIDESVNLVACHLAHLYYYRFINITDYQNSNIYELIFALIFQFFL